MPVQDDEFKNRKHHIKNFLMRKMEREAVSIRDRDRQIYGVRERMRIRER